MGLAPCPLLPAPHFFPSPSLAHTIGVNVP